MNQLYQLVDIRSDNTLVFFTKNAEYSQVKVEGSSTDVVSIGTTINIDKFELFDFSLNKQVPEFDYTSLLDEDFTDMLRMQNGQFVKTYHNSLHYSKCRKLWLHETKRIRDGEILFVTENKSTGESLVVKHQKVPLPDIDFTVTPGPCATEVRSLNALNYLMKVKGVAPVFCELRSKEIFIHSKNNERVLSTTMPMYATDFTTWIYGNNKDPDRKCVKKPPFSVSADRYADWVYSACAGHQLITSTHESDIQLFNDIVRSMLLQVCIGFAQAQRHMRYTHNDMHAGNVMFDFRNIKMKRLFITGNGSYMLSPGSPGIRIIDFQHAAFDLYNSSGNLQGKTQGYSMDFQNSYSLTFDLSRLCSYLILSLLRPYWPKIQPDIRSFLMKVSQLGEDADNPAFKTIPAEVQWSPFHVKGVLPADALKDPVFDVFRCEPTAEFNLIYYEQMPSAKQQDQYLRTLFARHKEQLPLELKRANFKSADTYKADPAVVPYLNAFATNYAGNAMGKALLMHKHTPQQKHNALLMQYTQLNSALYHFYSLKDEIKECINGPDRSLHLCALLDSVMCCVKLDYMWIMRPESQNDYHDIIKMYLRNERIREVIKQPVLILADSVLEYEDIDRDDQLEAWRSTLYNAVMACEM